MGQSEHDPDARRKPAWNAGRQFGAKRALEPQQVWAIRFWPGSRKRMRDRAKVNLAIDGRPQGCDIAAIINGDIVPGGRVLSRAIVALSHAHPKSPAEHPKMAPVEPASMVHDSF